MVRYKWDKLLTKGFRCITSSTIKQRFLFCFIFLRRMQAGLAGILRHIRGAVTCHSVTAWSSFPSGGWPWPHTSLRLATNLTQLWKKPISPCQSNRNSKHTLSGKFSSTLETRTNIHQLKGKVDLYLKWEPRAWHKEVPHLLNLRETKLLATEPCV